MSFWQQSSDIFAQFEEDKISRDARLLHFEGTGHAAQSGKDGLISIRLSRICDHDDPEALAAELEAIGLWERTDDGWLITDYLKHNRSSDEVERSRELARQRTERSRRHKQGDHSMCTRSKFCPEGMLEPVTPVTRDKTRNQTRDVTPSQLKTPQLNVSEVESGLRVEDVSSSDGSPALARGVPATEDDTRHLFVDDDLSGLCRFCGLPESNRNRHHDPKRIPDRITELAESIAGAGARVQVKHHKHDGGYSDWWLHGTAEGWILRVGTEWERGDSVGNITEVSVDLPMQPIAAEDDTPAWQAFYADIAALCDQFAPGAASPNDDGQRIYCDDGRLEISLYYDSDDPDCAKKSRQYLRGAVDNVIGWMFLRSVEDIAARHRKQVAA